MAMYSNHRAQIVPGDDCAVPAEPVEQAGQVGVERVEVVEAIRRESESP